MNAPTITAANIGTLSIPMGAVDYYPWDGHVSDVTYTGSVVEHRGPAVLIGACACPACETDEAWWAHDVRYVLVTGVIGEAGGTRVMSHVRPASFTCGGASGDTRCPCAAHR